MKTNRFVGMLRMMTGQNPASLAWSVVLITGLGIGLALLMFIEVHPWLAVPFLALACTGPVLFLYSLLRFVHYRGWRDRLPYELTGDFDVLERDRSSLDGWRACHLQIETTAITRDQLQEVRDALHGLTQRANRKMYETRWGKITRWQLESPTVAVGQADARVAWVLFKFLSGDLTRIVRSGIGIRSVHLKVSAEAVDVPAESTTFNQ